MLHKYFDKEQVPVGDLLAILSGHRKDKDWDKAMNELREAADGCPMCILSAIRQSGLQKCDIDEDGLVPGVDFKFDFKSELRSFWEDVNTDAYEREMEGRY